MNKLIGPLFIVIAAFCWALDTLIRYPLIAQGFSPLTLVFLEHTILCLIMSPLLYKGRMKIWNSHFSDLIYFMIIGGLGSALATLSFTKAFSLVNPSIVILLQKLQPLVVILLARTLLNEKIQKGFLVWASLCLLGSFLMSFNDLLSASGYLLKSNLQWTHSVIWGYVLAFIAVISWGASTVFGKKLTSKGFRPSEIMSGRFLFGFIFLIPLMTQDHFKNLYASGEGVDLLIKIAIMVFLSGLLAMYFYYAGLSRVSARLSALMEMFFPVFAVFINWYFLDQHLLGIQIFGAMLLLLGSVVIQYKHY